MWAIEDCVLYYAVGGKIFCKIQLDVNVLHATENNTQKDENDKFIFYCNIKC